MHSATNEVGHTVLPWLVIREDNNGNRYRVGRYATRDEAQRISDSLVARNHQQLYWVEKLTGPGGPPNPTLFRDFTQGARKSRLERLPQETPPRPRRRPTLPTVNPRTAHKTSLTGAYSGGGLCSKRSPTSCLSTPASAGPKSGRQSGATSASGRCVRVWPF